MPKELALHVGSQPAILGDARHELLQELIELVFEQLVAPPRHIGATPELHELHAVGVHTQRRHRPLLRRQEVKREQYDQDDTDQVRDAEELR